MSTDTPDRVFNVLFLCTGNSARSILAESALNMRGGAFRAYSAGSHPRGEVNPDALALLQKLHYPTEGLRSKSWDEFSTPDAPQMDFVFTVCGDAADEVCPVWPGHPITAHWGIADPSHVEGTDIVRERAFMAALRHLESWIALFTALPIHKLETATLSAKVREIGQTPVPAATNPEDAQ
ncbi:arsenate reductase ArsC [Novosphingobium rosa]|jgi:arsenate reductase|uniref:arsenate reductase ArsC n=1 Tax=Novosphingobium rosa TaxID=76978 RepID=UPI00082A5C1F|nr:arsenate reductase ArsC [Novosphingobium rosa]